MSSRQPAEFILPGWLGLPAAGCILLGHVGHIKWDDIGDGIPAFLTIVIMPFTYSGACLAWRLALVECTLSRTMATAKQQP